MKTLKADTRTLTGKKVKQIRNEGSIPAVIFGPKFDAKNISFKYADFRQVFNNVGYSKLFDIEIGEDKYKTIIKEMDIHPVSNKAIHVSLYAVDMNAEIEADVPINIIGLSSAVKNGLGFLETMKDTIRVKCLPGDLPAEIVVDISNLDQAGLGINTDDLDLGEKVELAGGEEGLRVVQVSEAQKASELEEEEGQEGEEDGDASGEDTAEEAEKEAK